MTPMAGRLTASVNGSGDRAGTGGRRVDGGERVGDDQQALVAGRHLVGHAGEDGAGPTRQGPGVVAGRDRVGVPVARDPAVALVGDEDGLGVEAGDGRRTNRSQPRQTTDHTAMPGRRHDEDGPQRAGRRRRPGGHGEEGGQQQAGVHVVAPDLDHVERGRPGRRPAGCRAPAPRVRSPARHHRDHPGAHHDRGQDRAAATACTAPRSSTGRWPPGTTTTTPPPWPGPSRGRAGRSRPCGTARRPPAGPPRRPPRPSTGAAGHRPTAPPGRRHHGDQRGQRTPRSPAAARDGSGCRGRPPRRPAPRPSAAPRTRTSRRNETPSHRKTIDISRPEVANSHTPATTDTINRPSGRTVPSSWRAPSRATAMPAGHEATRRAGQAEDHRGPLERRTGRTPWTTARVNSHSGSE